MKSISPALSLHMFDEAGLSVPKDVAELAREDS